jgi:acetyltransferase-like isoleucine patch superfamily enzyme
MNKSLSERIFTLIGRVKSKLFTMAISSCFKEIGDKVSIIPPFRFHNLQYVKIGDDVIIHQFVFFNVVDGNDCDQPKIDIRNHISIGMNSFISCAHKIILEDWVLIGRNVYISDHGHEYQDVTKPIKNQSLRKIIEVVIGAETWIGNNAIILPGAIIGKHCVIGANSIVNSAIPDFSVAAGSPAKIIKRYDSASNKWIKTIHD